MSIIEIDFVGGSMDGKVLSHYDNLHDNLPDFITFPCFPNISFYDFATRWNGELILQQEVYQRIADTYTYICVESPK